MDRDRTRNTLRWIEGRFRWLWRITTRVVRAAPFPIVLSASQQGKNISNNAPDGEGAYFDHMPGIEKGAKKVLKKAEGSSKKGSSKQDR
jgi:hypothetical protein